MQRTRSAAIYTRISLDRDGRSEAPERQEADCRKLAELRGWEVAEVYADRDTSAYSRKVRRPEYERMMRDLRDGRADALIVWKLDRLTRQGLTGVGPVLELVRDHGLDLVSVTESLDTSTPVGRGMVGMLASIAEQESENTSARVKRAHQSAVKRGTMHSGGSRQYGYRNGKIVRDEAEVIRECVRRVIDGESLRSIASDLNRHGVLTSDAGELRKARGRDEVYAVRGKWRSVTLSQVLRSPTLAGIRVHNGDVHENGTWEPIISQDEHRELLRVLASRRSDQSAGDRSHLLSGAGVIRCGLCLRPMRRMSFRQSNGRLFHRYQCARQPGQDQCGKLAISQGSTDDFVVGELLDFLDYAELRPLDGDESETELETQLVEARAAVTDLVQARYVRRKITQSDFELAHAPLEAEVEKLEVRLAGLRRRREERSLTVPLGDREALGVWWEAATDQEKIAAVRQAVQSVTVRPAKRRGGNRFDHNRVEIDWNWETFRVNEAGRALERF